MSPTGKKSDATPSEEGTSFEKGMGRLEEIVAELEKGEMPLEKSLALFEEGVALTRTLDARLSDAEMKIEKLLRASSDGTAATHEDDGP